MATPNPMSNESEPAHITISKKTFLIAGILVDILGLEEIPAHVEKVAVVWLLNPRLASKSWMGPSGEHIVKAWNDRLRALDADVGLIAAAFDQRNHGTRMYSDRANKAWRDGNPMHAMDMFSIFQGTAADTSSLITYIAGYVFPTGAKSIIDHMVMGVSLGGHAAWHCVLHEPRISTAAVVVGCADYVRVMTDRAAKSKLASWHSSEPKGSAFLGSSDFPPALLAAVETYDPAALLMRKMVSTEASDVERAPTAMEAERLMPLMIKHLANKHIINLAGASDKLVPYSASVPFLKWLKSAISAGGWFAGHGVELIDNVYSGVGHQMTPQMLDDVTSFLLKNLINYRASAYQRSSI